MISIEEYLNYDGEESKIKLIVDDKYIEKKINKIDISNEKIVFDDLVITSDNLELFIDNYHINFKVDNNELLLQYSKTNKGKNNYQLFETFKFTGAINDSEVSGKIFVDFESIFNISDDYYKIYCIDFIDFSGTFNMVSYDGKTPNVILKYKDEIFKNKKISNVRDVQIFKLTKYKLTVSGNYYWKINMKVKKTHKSNPSIIPFKYQFGILSLTMKKNLFKTNLKAMSKDMLLITYKYI